MFWDFVAIAVLIALNGFFVAVEFAAVTSRRVRLTMIAEADSRPVRIVEKWLDDPSARDRLIAASQLGITIVSLMLGAVVKIHSKNCWDHFFTASCSLKIYRYYNRSLQLCRWSYP